MKAKRKVAIVKVPSIVFGGYAVLFIDRNKHQRYAAANFCSDYDYDYVKSWVVSQPHLELVENEKDVYRDQNKNKTR